MVKNVSKRGKKISKMTKNWTKNKFSKKIFFSWLILHISMPIIWEKNSMILHNFRTYFLSHRQLQAPFSNLLTRANNRRPYFFSSVFYEIFDSTCLIHPEMSRKLAIFTNKKVKRLLKNYRFYSCKLFGRNFHGSI